MGGHAVPLPWTERTFAQIIDSNRTKLVSADYIKPCSRSDPKFNECALKNGKEALPRILKGKSLCNNFCQHKIMRDDISDSCKF
jgi:hypothetical protein